MSSSSKSAFAGQEREIVIRRHIPLHFNEEPPVARDGVAPVKEFSAQGPSVAGRDSERFTGRPDMPGRHVLFLLVRKDNRELPVVEAVDGNERTEAVMIFTRREAAFLYLQVARSDEYSIESLAPHQASQLVKALRNQGIDALVVDPNRRREDGRSAAATLRLAELNYDSSGENLYQEVFDRTGK
jgi:hypothetical protein